MTSFFPVFSCRMSSFALPRTPSLSFLPYATFAVRTPCTLIGNGSDLAFALVGRRGRKEKVTKNNEEGSDARQGSAREFGSEI